MSQSKDECLVASLEGKWGSGKTSVVGMMKTHYERKNFSTPIEVMEFSPWMACGMESLTKEFLEEFARTLKMMDAGGKALAAGEELQKYSSLFGVLKFVPGSEPWVSLIESVMKSTGVEISDAGSLKLPSLGEQKNRVIKALGETNTRYVIIIDDIDRLVADEIYEMLRLVKSVSDFPNVSYLLVCDRYHIEESLEKIGFSKASEFLEKIVQIRFTLPTIYQGDTMDFMTSLFSGITDRRTEGEPFGGIPDEEWRKTLSRSILPLLETPRDVVRLANRIHACYPIIKGEIDFCDYCCLELIGVIEPTIYDHIKANPVQYLGVRESLIFYTSESERKHMYKERVSLLKEVSSVRKIQLLEALIRKLFPNAVSEPENDKARGHSYASRASGQISNFENFEIAFYYKRPDYIISLEDLNAIWKEPDERNRIFDRWITENKAARALIVINEFSKDGANIEAFGEVGVPEDHLGFLKDYTCFMDKIYRNSSIRENLVFDCRLYLDSITKALITTLPEGERSKAMRDICGSKDLVAAGCKVVQMSLKKRKIAEESGIELEKSEYTGLDNLNAVWSVQARAALKDGSLWESVFLQRVFFTLIELGFGDSVITEILNPNLLEEHRFNGLLALSFAGTSNGKAYVGLKKEDWGAWSSMDFEKCAEAASSLSLLPNEKNSRLQAVQNAYANLENNYFLETADQYRRNLD